jgi:NAD(P)-dependent dehydrogenase (short-subunit alcohol dehydrogenase family)
MKHMTHSTVLITGAASGIGRAAAFQFARQGWRCVLVDRDAAGLDSLCQELPPPAQVNHLVCVTDLTRDSDIQALAVDAPPLDALVNNAGISDRLNLPLVDQTWADLDRLLTLNLHAPAALVRALAPRLDRGARIVNVASGAGLRAIPWRGAYSPSKAGLIAQSQALAQARPDWCVTVLSPGFVRTELVAGLIAAARLKPEGVLAKIPMGRMAEPEEMAAALCFLASPAAAPLSGQVLTVDGGSSVYGGSQPLPASELPSLPISAPLALAIEGSESAPWLHESSQSPSAYRACLEVGLCQVAPGQRLHAAHALASRFASRHGQQASLTLLLPRPAAVDWSEAGEAAAVRMLVATLACEWGAKGLRINALELGEGMSPQRLSPLIHFIAGAGAQYLTGQTLSMAAESGRAAA